MLQLDHLVILVQNRDQAIADYERLGFRVTPGGAHADGLTHNALVVFADGAYLELIAFIDPDDPRDNTWGWRQFVPRGAGLIDYCCSAGDLATAAPNFRAAGLSVHDPVAGGRLRPDGTALRWRSARFWQAARELPFLIEDVTPRELRVPQEMIDHPNGVTGVRELVIAVLDLERGVEQFRAITGVEPQRSADRRRDARLATFPLGAQAITLAAPTFAYSPIEQHIHTIGLGPYEIVLAGGSKSVQLDQRLTHGARLRVR